MLFDAASQANHACEIHNNEPKGAIAARIMLQSDRDLLAVKAVGMDWIVYAVSCRPTPDFLLYARSGGALFMSYSVMYWEGQPRKRSCVHGRFKTADFSGHGQSRWCLPNSDRRPLLQL